MCIVFTTKQKQTMTAKDFLTVMIGLWVFIGIAAIYLGSGLMADTTIEPEGNVVGTLLLCTGVLVEAIMIAILSIITFFFKKP